MDTIPLLFRAAVERFPGSPALLEPGEGNEMTSLTYSALQERVDAFAGYLQQQSVTKGDRLLLWSASRADWLVAYFGALLTGMVVVPLDVNTREDFLRRLAETTEARFLVTTQKAYNSLKQPPLSLIDIDALPQAPLSLDQLP